MMRTMSHRLASPLLALLLVALAACAPAPGTAPTGTAAPANPEDLAILERTAWEAWHLMELGRLRSGVYTTNALVDLPLPQGVRWTLLAFDETAYELSVSSDEGSDGFLVDPSGVRSAG